MRVTIFWRVIVAQSVLIVSLLGVSYYTFTQFTLLTALSTDVLKIDAENIAPAKRLLKLFLTQMRNAQKSIHLRDRAFYEQFTQGHSAVETTLTKLDATVDTPDERQILEHIRTKYTEYVQNIATVFNRKSAWSDEKDEALSTPVISGLNEFIRMSEELRNNKTTAVRDQSALVARYLLWVMGVGITLALIMAYRHARAISQPLRRLQQALVRVSQGVFHDNLDVSAPKEVSALAQVFNHMTRRLAELDRMKADFIAHVSHDLRTPLTGIYEGTALLLEGVPDPLTSKQQEILAVVQTHSQRLFRSVMSILDLTKMEAGMMEYRPVPSDVRLLLGRALDTVQLLVQKKQLYVDLTVTDGLPLVRCDEARLQQVFDNLLSNAVKFTSEGGSIAVLATLQQGPAPEAKRLEVRVADNGVGIPEEEVERIFERFYQSDFHKDMGQHGTGLGLAMARHVVEAHGGTIRVESHIGIGSTFIVTLPVPEDTTKMEK